MKENQKKDEYSKPLDIVMDILEKNETNISVLEAASLLRATFGALHESGNLFEIVEKKAGKKNVRTLVVSILTSYFLSLYNCIKEVSKEELNEIIEQFKECDGEYVLLSPIKQERNLA